MASPSQPARNRGVPPALCWVVGFHLACASARPLAEPPPLPRATQQLALREQWLEHKHGLLLEMMRRHGVGMWLIVGQEFHEDPLTPYVAPPLPYGGDFLTVFAFVDTGEGGLKKYALAKGNAHLERFFEPFDEKLFVFKALGELVTRHQPRAIALNMGGTRGVTSGLTHDVYTRLVKFLGPEAEARFIPAEPLVTEYLDTRLPEEREPYRALVMRTEDMVRRALSSEVVKPGVTRVGDVLDWLSDELGRAGVGTWFQPTMRVQREGEAGAMQGVFLAPSRPEVVIQRGDVLHVDFGLSALGLSTDWQRMAYVLREGERDVPRGLQGAMANMNALQDALVEVSRPGRTNAEVYEAVMARMKEKGIQAQVYSHPLGNQGHGLGASIDFRAAKREDPPRPLRAGAYAAIELNARSPVPEWKNQEVFVFGEDPAELTDAGWRFFVPRQDAWYVIP